MTHTERSFEAWTDAYYGSEVPGNPGQMAELSAYQFGRTDERDDIADWLDGWAEGYAGDNTELATALKAYASDIREGIRRD